MKMIIQDNNSKVLLFTEMSVSSNAFEPWRILTSYIIFAVKTGLKAKLAIFMNCSNRKCTWMVPSFHNSF